MEKKLDLEDTVRAVTEQPWARIRALGVFRYTLV